MGKKRKGFAERLIELKKDEKSISHLFGDSESPKKLEDVINSSHIEPPVVKPVSTKKISESIKKSKTKQIKLQTNKPTSQQTNKLTNQQVDNSLFNPTLKPKDLTLIQFRLLFEIYFIRPYKMSGKNRLGVTEKFEIPYETVRHSIRSLEKKGYIAKPFKAIDGKNQGSTCKVNEKKCVPLFGKPTIKNSQQINKSTNQQINKLIAEG